LRRATARAGAHGRDDPQSRRGGSGFQVDDSLYVFSLGTIRLVQRSGGLSPSTLCHRIAHDGPARVVASRSPTGTACAFRFCGCRAHEEVIEMVSVFPLSAR
jgi:hypothetical protein